MYLIACTVLLYHAFFRSVRFIKNNGLDQMWKACLLLVPAMLSAAPIIALFYDSYRLQSDAGLPTSGGEVTVWLSLIGAILSLTLLIAQRVQNSRAGSLLGFWGVGWLAFSSLLTIIVGTSALKQISFVDQHAGMVAFDYFRDQVTDMKCDSAVILAKYKPGEPVRYRCPTSVILNRFSSVPFVPWPDYNEGESEQLARAIEQVRGEAIQVE